MKSNQGSFMKRAVLAGLIAGGGVLAVSAYAVSNDVVTPRCQAHGQKGDAEWAKRAEHLNAMKEKLKLAPNQEAAWNAFTAASQGGMHKQGMGREAMRDDIAKLTTPERLERMQARAEMRRTSMTARVEAIKAFYAQLTPEQQKVFDAEAMPNRHGGHRGHRHHG